MRAIFVVLSTVICGLIQSAQACTAAIATRRATPDGLSVLWKNRDTGCLDNYVGRVDATEGRHGYVALFNAPDSLMAEAWAGVNDAGFGIINTASYNLAPDTARVRDREGVVMTLALGRCRTLADFEALLDSLPRPMGVQANFGVTDACGGAAWYETSDNGYRRFEPGDDGLIIRTNFSESGDPLNGGLGYIRYDNARHLIMPMAAEGRVTPESLVCGVSRSFYHTLFNKDMAADSTAAWLTDNDFIPRYSTSASVAIVSGDSVTAPYMLVALGYPPCAVAMRRATPDYVPEELCRDPHTGRAADSDAAAARKEAVFPIKRGSGPRYIDTRALRRIQGR